MNNTLPQFTRLLASATPGPLEIHQRHPDLDCRKGYAEITGPNGSGFLGEGFTVAIADMYCMEEPVQQGG